MARPKGSAVKLMSNKPGLVQMNYARFGAMFAELGSEILWLEEADQVSRCEELWDDARSWAGDLIKVPRPIRANEIQQWANQYGPRLFALLIESMGDGDAQWIERLAVAVKAWHQAESKAPTENLRLWLAAGFRSPAVDGPQVVVWPLRRMMEGWSKWSHTPLERIDVRQFRRACAEVGVIVGKVKVGTKKGSKKIRH